MSENKLTAVDYLQSIEIERDLNLGDWSNAKEIENEQNIKAAARGFLNRQEEINSLTKKFQKDNIMNEKIIDKLMTENLMLSNDNVKVRQAYMQLLDVYCELLQTKNPDNLMLPGRNDWENKVK
jgi:hypothetical protein